MAKANTGKGSAAGQAVDLIQARLVEYAGGLTYDRLPPEVVQAARLRIIDTLGAAIGGYFGEPCRIARAVADGVTSDRGATVLGTGTRTSAELAAFANATAARHLEYTDFYHWPGALDGHASDVLGAVLAAAEQGRCNGRAMLTATVLGYEVFLRFCDIFPKGGFDYTNCSVLGSAVAAGWLMGLTPAQLGHCISMAVVPNVILKQVRREGKTAFKPAATGHAARAGVFAAQLAKAGMEGPNLPFEGSFGFCDHVLGKRFTLGPMGGEGGTPFKILDSRIKIRPSERNTVPLILAAERLAPLDAAEVERITVEIYAKALQEVGTGDRIWNPQSHYDAYHSIPYVVAAALAQGTVTLRSFDEGQLRNPQVRGLMARMELVENAEFTRAFHAVPVEHHARITVHLAGGATRVSATGGSQDPQPDTDPAQILAKFRSLTEDVLGRRQVDAILDRLLQLEAEEDISALPPLFVI